MDIEQLFKKVTYEIKEISQIDLNPDNPRFITEKKLKELKKELTKNPNGLLLNPLKLRHDGVVLGGNQRLTAIRELGWKSVPVLIAPKEMTEDELNRFIVIDNVPFGTWDQEKLKYEKWVDLPLEEWDVIPWKNVDEEDLEDFFTEPDIQGSENELITLSLKYTQNDYDQILDQLEKRPGTKEQIIFQLLCEPK